MNNDAPETLAAVRSRAAELEQQLKLSDEGVSRLAQRCLELEQQVLAYEAALASHGAENETGALLLPQLFYDSGSGFSARECLTVASDAYDELTHEVSAVFELPADVQALRLDPGEFACCITDFTISDERLSYQPANGTVLREGTMLFLGIDPNLTVRCATGFAPGMRFAVTYHYYPLGRYLHEQPGKTLLSALNVLRQNAQDAQAAAQAAAVQTAAAQQEAARLQAQLAEQQEALAETCQAYDASLEAMKHSTSWKLTAPLRALLHCFRRP